VALLEWLDPLFAPGHWVPEQIERAGGESVIGVRGERSRESSWEALATAAVLAGRPDPRANRLPRAKVNY